MPEFSQMTSEEEQHYQLFRRFNRQSAALNLRRLGAEAMIILADAITTSEAAKGRRRFDLLRRLAERKAVAYESLSRQRGAMRWVAYRLYRSFKGMGLTP